MHGAKPALFEPLVALVIAVVMLATTLRSLVTSHRELLWPATVVCGHPDP